MRVGLGYDIHRLADGRPLVLGGIAIPHPKGLSGHSDADVVLHAVIDALLGAAGVGDIGQHFPDTDPAYRQISSLELLRRVRAIIEQRGCAIANIDTTILAEEPNLSAYKPAMAKQIETALGLPGGSVNVKAHTFEGVGLIGRGEAMAAYAVVLVQEVGR